MKETHIEVGLTVSSHSRERKRKGGGGSQHGARAKVSTDAVDFLVAS